MTATTVRAGGIAMIGGGRMASALAEGFCRAGLLSPAEIVVHDPSPAAREALVARVPGVRLAATPAEAAGAAEIVWLAVKPQQAAAACGGITDVMPGRTLVSILAGLTTATLAKLAGTPRVIRVMPNTPCLVGQGVSVACRTPEVPEAVATRVSQLLAAVGHVHEVDESWMDAVIDSQLNSINKNSSLDGDFLTKASALLKQPGGAAKIKEAGLRPDLRKRGAIRSVFDGRYQFTRYFSPKQHNLPTSIEGLFALNDVELFDTQNDPHEMNNLALDREKNADLLMAMNAKLNRLIADEVGEDVGQMLPGGVDGGWVATPAVNDL